MKNEPHQSTFTVSPGVNTFTIPKEWRLTKNLFAFQTGVGGDAATMTFRTKTINSIFQTPGAPYSIIIPTNRSISFDGEPLEAVEVTNSSAFTFIMNLYRSEA
jgi:hypothetical protein